MTTSDTSSTSAHTTVPAAATYLEAQTATGRWTLDPSATEVHFHTTSMWGLAKVHGQFMTVTGDGTVDADGNATGTLTIEASSLTTKIKTRDKHLRSAAFFEVNRYPTLSFIVREITPLPGSDIEVAGDLTIRGKLQPLTIR